MGECWGEMGRLENMRYFSGRGNGFGSKDGARENIGDAARSGRVFPGSLVTNTTSKMPCFIT